MEEESSYGGVKTNSDVNVFQKLLIDVLSVSF